MGSQKLLLPYGPQSLLRHVVKKALSAAASEVVVVINTEFADLFNEISDLPIVILPNEESHLGMSTSLRKGFAYLGNRHVEGGLVLLADQPGIEPAVLDEVIDRFGQIGKGIVQAAYRGKPGHPVLFARHLFDEIQQISGDQGARELIISHLADRELVMIDTEEPNDIDTPAEYQEATQKGGSGK